MNFVLKRFFNHIKEYQLLISRIYGIFKITCKGMKPIYV